MVFTPSVPAAPAGESLRDKIRRRRKVTKVVSWSECFPSKSKFIENKTEVRFSLSLSLWQVNLWGPSAALMFSISLHVWYPEYTRLFHHPLEHNSKSTVREGRKRTRVREDTATRGSRSLLVLWLVAETVSRWCSCTADGASSYKQLLILKYHLFSQRTCCDYWQYLWLNEGKVFQSTKPSQVQCGKEQIQNKIKKKPLNNRFYFSLCVLATWDIKLWLNTSVFICVLCFGQ